MSPLSLRRYRAERLLRDEFEALRGRVLAKVRGRLRASGIRLDASDLDACYGQAWQGLYTALLAGQQIESPAGWLVVVTFRRAIEEHRARPRAASEHGGNPAEAIPGRREQERARDLATELDDRMRLRQLFEGLRGRLGPRELEAAVLCYLQGLSRSQAAERMGVSETRMRKLMEGRRAGQPGVAGKVGALVETIRAGSWCEEQGSLMRGLAYGILDPEGERYRLAVMHRSECPACRAYVVSLRGLAVALPPVFSPAGIGAAALGLAGGGTHAGVAGAVGTGVAGSAASAGTPASAGIGSISASGAAGAGAGGAGGGWMLGAGPLGAKLAVGCALALGLGAGCVALGGSLGQPHPPTPHRPSRALSKPTPDAGIASVARLGAGAARSHGSRSAATWPRLRASVRRAPVESGGAGREFGPEQGSRPAEPLIGIPPAAGSATARSAAATPAAAQTAGAAPSRESSGSGSAAAHEFAPG